MDPIYGLLLLILMMIGFIAARRAAVRSRQSLDQYRKRRRTSSSDIPLTTTGSPRSDMRSFDDPTTVMDALQKPPRPWKDDTRPSSRHGSRARQKT
jgi:hypothetical protein